MAEFHNEIEAGRRLDKDFASEEIKLRAKIISSEYAGKCIDLSINMISAIAARLY